MEDRMEKIEDIRPTAELSPEMIKTICDAIRGSKTAYAKSKPTAILFHITNSSQNSIETLTNVDNQTAGDSTRG
jgi:hypothetical protein